MLSSTRQRSLLCNPKAQPPLPNKPTAAQREGDGGAAVRGSYYGHNNSVNWQHRTQLCTSLTGSGTGTIWSSLFIWVADGLLTYHHRRAWRDSCVHVCWALEFKPGLLKADDQLLFSCGCLSRCRAQDFQRQPCRRGRGHRVSRASA